jgi:hypothetical protein
MDEEWMGVWMDGWLAGWLDGCINVHRRMDEEWMGVWMDGWLAGWMGFGQGEQSKWNAYSVWGTQRPSQMAPAAPAARVTHNSHHRCT